MILASLRWHGRPARAITAGIGAAIGAVLVLWFLATRPGLDIEVVGVVVLSLLEGGLAAGVLLLVERPPARAVEQVVMEAAGREA